MSHTSLAMMMSDKEDLYPQPRSSRTPSTASSQMRPYEELSITEKYKMNIALLKSNKHKALSNMASLAKEEDFLESQLFMGSYYSNGAHGSFDAEQATYFYSLAHNNENKKNKDAANALGCLYYAIGDNEMAKKLYNEAITLGSEVATLNLQELQL